MKIADKLLNLVGVGRERGLPPPRLVAIADGLLVTERSAEAWFLISVANTDLATEAEQDAALDAAVSAAATILGDRLSHLKVVWGRSTGQDYLDSVAGHYRLDAVRAPERSEEIDILALAAEEAARDGITVEGKPATVRGDRTLLRRMIRNLIDNARRHGSDTAPEISVGVSGPWSMIAIRDHGRGIPEHEREKIFEPFYRLAGSAESGRGSGLGLALVRQIARHHGGDVRCVAAPGGGSVFEVALPLAREPA